MVSMMTPWCYGCADSDCTTICQADDGMVFPTSTIAMTPILISIRTSENNGLSGVDDNCDG